MDSLEAVRKKSVFTRKGRSFIPSIGRKANTFPTGLLSPKGNATETTRDSIPLLFSSFTVAGTLVVRHKHDAILEFFGR